MLLALAACDGPATRTANATPSPTTRPAVASASAIAGPVTSATPGTPAAPGTQPADNSYCFTCHANFRKEDLAHQHQRAGIGCVRCHGESDRHSSDEDGLTAPDIIFAKEIINPSCTRCHLAGQLAKVPVHREVFLSALSTAATSGGSGGERSCSEVGCHGRHRMEVRTRRWDKLTRKLIADDGVRMINQATTPGTTPAAPATPPAAPK